MKEQNKDSSFEEIIELEIQKRNNYIAEADSIIETIEQHCKEKKEELESIDLERNTLIKQLHDVVNNKDLSQLDRLFERLR